MEAQTQPPTYRFGLAMAGAVSAGAYTAGAMDHFFHTLRYWALRKQTDTDNIIPRHCIEIEALSGASAGGIMTALVAFARHVPIKTITHNQRQLETQLSETGNLFYDTWVNLLDTKNRTTFDQLLDVEDLSEEGLVSLFNARVIDRIADKVKQTVTDQWQDKGTDIAHFMADNMEMIITLCNLEGVPFGIEFQYQGGKSKVTPSYRMVNHKLIAWFGYQRQPGQAVLPIAKDKLDAILDCAKGTSAFPIGFKPRVISGWTLLQVRESLTVLQGIGARLTKFILKDKMEPLSFQVVDGGTLNNEPFSELFRLLQFRSSRRKTGESTSEDKPMILLVDPFPDLHLDNPGPSITNLSIYRVIGHLISTLLNQSRFKVEDLMELNGMDDFERRMIFPSRYILHKDDEGYDRLIPLPRGSHIACGPLGGFAGFLHRKFRVHDFLLGQINTRMFIRYFCTLPCNPNDPASWPSIFKDWTPYMVMRYMSPSSTRSVYFLPVIPELEFVEQVEQKMEAAGYTFSHIKENQSWANDDKKLLSGALWEEFELRKKFTHEVADTWRRNLQFPKISASEFMQYRSPLKKRIQAIILTIVRRKISGFSLLNLIVLLYPSLLIKVFRNRIKKRQPKKDNAVKKKLSGWWILPVMVLTVMLVFFTPLFIVKAVGWSWTWGWITALVCFPVLLYLLLKCIVAVIVYFAMKGMLSALHAEGLVSWDR